ncbi:MAG: T9SS type A sorting domain-containing protein [candidate division WOR-3 bacterium]
MKTGLFTLLVFPCALSFAVPSLIWFKAYDSGYNDYAQGIAIDSSWNVVVTGTSYNGIDFDCFTIKYNPLGDTIWTRRFDTGTSDIARSVAIDVSGNIIVVGSSRVDSIYDYLIIKYDSNGNLIWVRRYQTQFNNFGMGVAIDINQNIIVTGYSFNGNSYDYLTIKFSQTGDTIWSRRLDYGYNDLAQDIAVDGDNNIIVTGFSFRDSIFAYLTVKYDSLGNTLWVRHFLSPYYDNKAYGVTADFDNNIIVIGMTPAFPYIVKYNPMGDTLWTYYYNGNWWGGWFTEPRDITVDSLNNILFVSSFTQLTYESDYATIKCTPDGDTVWHLFFRESLYDTLDAYARGIAISPMGDIVVTGYEHNHTDYDYVTVKYSESGVIEETPQVQAAIDNFITVFPNPFTNYCVIHYALSTMHYAENGVASSQKSVVSMKIYNSTGQLVKQFNHLTIQPFNQIIWDGDESSGQRLPPGVYFVCLRCGGFSAIKKVVKLGG